jgi:hypothetical protein
MSVQFPMPFWAEIRRIGNGLLEKLVHHSARLSLLGDGGAKFTEFGVAHKLVYLTEIRQKLRANVFLVCGRESCDCFIFSLPK